MIGVGGRGSGVGSGLGARRSGLGLPTETDDCDCRPSTVDCHIIQRCAIVIFGRTGWQVSEVGYGMWGMAGWTGQRRRAIVRSRSIWPSSSAATSSTLPGPTATATASVSSAQLLKRHPGKRLYAATKIPPKNRKWPARAGYPLDDVFPADYIREYTEKSLRNIGVSDARPAAASCLERCVGRGQ